MTNYCRDCDLVHPDSRKPTEPWKWVCLAVPVAPGYGLVDPDFSPTPPYEKCDRVRKQMQTLDCPMFEKRREVEKVA